MAVDVKIGAQMQRLLQMPGSEGMSSADVLAWAIELAHRNNSERMFGMPVSAEGYAAMSVVIDLAITAALTSDDWLAIHHVAEMVGIEDTIDDMEFTDAVA